MGNQVSYMYNARQKSVGHLTKNIHYTVHLANQYKRSFFSSPVTSVSVICEAATESNPELYNGTKYETTKY